MRHNWQSWKSETETEIAKRIPRTIASLSMETCRLEIPLRLDPLFYRQDQKEKDDRKFGTKNIIPF